MVFIELLLMARTQFVDTIALPEQNPWHLKIKCAHCNSQFPKIITIDKAHHQQMTKQHGLANFIAKCKNCQRKGSIRIDDKSPYEVKPDQDGLIKSRIALFECRGIDIVEVEIGDYLSVKGQNSSIIFKNVDLTQLIIQLVTYGVNMTNKQLMWFKLMVLSLFQSIQND